MTLQQWLSKYFENVVDVQGKFEDSKGITRSRKWKKYRTNNEQKKKYKRIDKQSSTKQYI